MNKTRKGSFISIRIGIFYYCTFALVVSVALSLSQSFHALPTADELIAEAPFLGAVMDELAALPGVQTKVAERKTERGAPSELAEAKVRYSLEYLLVIVGYAVALSVGITQILLRKDWSGLLDRRPSGMRAAVGASTMLVVALGLGIVTVFNIDEAGASRRFDILILAPPSSCMLAMLSLEYLLAVTKSESNGVRPMRR
jgi:hypothetical protein